jgi:hypothetical protein
MPGAILYYPIKKWTIGLAAMLGTAHLIKARRSNLNAKL